MHPFDSNKRAYVTPTKVEALHVCVWDGKVTRSYPSIHDLRRRVASQLASFREDHLRRVNPTPFKISLNADLHQFMHLLWQQEMPIVELS
jgi:nicotinate phosphoribosyltransferase